jgi:lactoylglutathione lyase
MTVSIFSHSFYLQESPALALKFPVTMASSKIDHLTIYSSKENFERLIEWYKKALSPLGYKEIMRFPEFVGLGAEVPDFWIAQKNTNIPSGIHFAFTSPGNQILRKITLDLILMDRSALDRATVEAFHKAAIDAGGICNGKPGLRPEYHENYYGAFVLDPVGNNVELVSTQIHPSNSSYSSVFKVTHRPEPM